MNQHLIDRLAEEWAQLDPVDPLRGLISDAIAEINKQPAQQQSAERVEPVAIHQFRTPGCSDWYDGVPDHHDGHGPYEVRTLYTSPPASKPWVGLTDEEIDAIRFDITAEHHTEKARKFYNAIEAKLREKNA